MKIAAKKALRCKIWSYVAKVFKILSVILAAGSHALLFLHPLGPLQSTALMGASTLYDAVSQLIQGMKDSECPSNLG